LGNCINQEIRPLLDLLAQTSAPASGGGLGQFGLFLPLAFVGVLYYVLLVLPRRKQDKQRQSMLNELKKGDRIQTIGGVLGTVVSSDATEVVVKVDESTNTKMRFVRTAVSKVITDTTKPETK
jgi:preprotein translocase subunit YajC